MRARFTQRLTIAALMAALCAVLSQILLPLPPVPANLALLAVHLCGALLGPHWGAAAVGGYVALGAVGMPVYAGFAGGPSVLLGPTGGYILGYMLCAALEGRMMAHLPYTRRSLLAAMVLGTLVCYAFGTAWFMALTGTQWWSSLTICVFPFLPGDALKILLASSLCLRLQKPLAALGLSF